MRPQAVGPADVTRPHSTRHAYPTIMGPSGADNAPTPSRVTPYGPRPSQRYAVRIAAACPRPSSSTAASRILNFWILPVTVIGKASVKRQ